MSDVPPFSSTSNSGDKEADPPPAILNFQKVLDRFRKNYVEFLALRSVYPNGTKIRIL